MTDDTGCTSCLTMGTMVNTVPKYRSRATDGLLTLSLVLVWHWSVKSTFWASASINFCSCKVVSLARQQKYRLIGDTKALYVSRIRWQTWCSTLSAAEHIRNFHEELRLFSSPPFLSTRLKALAKNWVNMWTPQRSARRPAEAEGHTSSNHLWACPLHFCVLAATLLSHCCLSIIHTQAQPEFTQRWGQ